MLRGSQKRMIVVRTRDSRVFEEAYFVMRRGADKPGIQNSDADELDMLWEANRILESSLAKSKGTATLPRQSPPVKHKAPLRILWFTVGMLSGSGLVGLLWFLL